MQIGILRVALLASSTFLFLASSGFAIIGIGLFLDLDHSAGSVLTSIIFLGTGVVTWAARRGGGLSPPEDVMIVVGAVAMNLGACMMAFSLSYRSEGADVEAFALVTCLLALVNVVSLIGFRVLRRRAGPDS